MRNLYSVISSPQAIRDLARAVRDQTGDLAPLPAVLPDQVAPIVRTAPDGLREIVTMRWGFPPPPNAGCDPVTNVHNSLSGWWRPWMQAGHRCLVPVTSFCEWTDSQPKVLNWFALDETRPLFFFAGIWRPFTGERRGEAGEHLLFSFLTTVPNAVVAPIRAKAMPMLLLDEDARDTWLTGSLEAALALKHPAPDNALQIVATGSKHGRI
jgi:putative SOS response-associated peptidase YedK